MYFFQVHLCVYVKDYWSNSAYSLTSGHHWDVLKDDTARYLQLCEKMLAGECLLFYPNLKADG